MKIFLMVVISILISVSSPQVFAQFSSLEKDNMLVITKSDEISDVILDGRWTSITEWKHSTLSKFQYDDDKKIILKSAHSGNYIYILIDFIGDHTLDNMSDKATICFDSKNNKSKLPDNNDYCFSVALGQKQGNVFQGGSPFPLNSYLQKIEVEDYFSASSKSKIDNKFSSMTHPVYELKIPIELLGRSDNYGFFVSVYEANSDKYYNWPIAIQREGLEIPSPEKWGDIISPDKSLPEFDIPLLIIISSLLTITLISRKVSFPKII